MDKRLTEFYNTLKRKDMYWGQEDWQGLIDCCMSTDKMASTKLSYLRLAVRGKLHFLQEELNRQTSEDVESRIMKAKMMKLMKILNESTRVSNPYK